MKIIALLFAKRTLCLCELCSEMFRSLVITNKVYEYHREYAL